VNKIHFSHKINRKKGNLNLIKVFVIHEPEGLSELDDGGRHSEGRRKLDEALDDRGVRLVVAVVRQARSQVKKQVLN
jgi:hypothetical protein